MFAFCELQIIVNNFLVPTALLSLLKPFPFYLKVILFFVHWHANLVLRQTNFSNFHTLIFSECGNNSADTLLTDPANIGSP